MTDQWPNESEPATRPILVRAGGFAAHALTSATWCHLAPELGAIDLPAVFAATGRVARKVRGSRMPTWVGCYDEFAAAWQFEDFGTDLDAFDDSMESLHLYWPKAEGFVVVILEAHRLFVGMLTDSSARLLEGLVESFQSIVDGWAEPVPGPPDDMTARPALSFDVVLVTPPEHRESVTAAWRAAGAPLDPST